jgi:DNA-binding NtrC family response regulator
MQYCLLQLALTKYPARLIEASKEAGVVKMDIPFEINVDYLIDHVDRARREVSSGLRVDEPELNDIVHDCRPMRLAIKRVRRIAPRNISILIQGPSGTGKKLIGRLLHKLSQRSMRPLEIFNCGAIPEDLLEVELFGSEIYDPLDDATKTTKGRLEQANNSTLFLDEVSELPLQIQVKLLRAIEDGEFTRVGGTKTIKADIRFISATNHRLNEEVAGGKFRADLFYRLAEDVVSLPALQNRDDDVSLITQYLLPELCKKLGYEEKTANAGALNLLKKYPFPGNVRELSNILVRAIVHSDSNQISKVDIEDALSISPVPDDPTTILEKPLGQSFSLNDLLDQVARHYINRAGEATNKNRGKASKLLGFNNYQTLSKRMDKLGIKW